jgi:hypothetical protein
MQLIKFLAHLHELIDLRDQLLIGALHAIVHVSHYKVEVAHHVRINLFTLESHFLDELTHHLITFFEAFLTVDEMYINHVEEVVVKLEGDLEATLVAHDTSHSCRDRTLMLILDMLYMLGFDEYDEEHFPHGDLPDAQEPVPPKVVSKIHHY